MSVGLESGLYRTYFAFTRGGGLQTLVDKVRVLMEGMCRLGPMEVVAGGPLVQLRSLYAYTTRVQAKLLNGWLVCMARSLVGMPHVSRGEGGLSWVPFFRANMAPTFRECFLQTVSAVRFQRMETFSDADVDYLAHAEEELMVWIKVHCSLYSETILMPRYLEASAE